MIRSLLVLAVGVSIGLAGSRSDAQSRYSRWRGSNGRSERRDDDTRRDDRRSGESRGSYRFKTAHERLPKDIPDWFIDKDQNEDGQVTMAEFSTKWDDSLLAEFVGFDRDGDGIVTPKECLAAREEGAVFSGNAVSSPSAPPTATRTSSPVSRTPGDDETRKPAPSTELAAAAGAPADTDSTAEKQADGDPQATPPEADNQPKAAETEGEHAGTEPDRAAAPVAENVDIPDAYLKYSISFIRKYDTDKNGMLTTDEWQAMPKSPASADFNGDGRVTPQEHALSIMKP